MLLNVFFKLIKQWKKLWGGGGGLKSKFGLNLQKM
jgi:hypothetical protein